jgi:hypothetical protein
MAFLEIYLHNIYLYVEPLSLLLGKLLSIMTILRNFKETAKESNEYDAK